MQIWAVKLPSVAVPRLYLKFALIQLVLKPWAAENQSLGRLSEHQNLQREHCIEV